MPEPKQNSKMISRRDALKILGAAAGATVLANLPSKWKTPEIASGVLPAHAQTSGFPVVVTVMMTCNQQTNQVTFDGNLTADGGDPVSDRGFVWSTSNTSPTIGGLASNVASLGAGGLGAFQFILVAFNVTVYGRAYATNSAGTAYGSVTNCNVCLVEGTLVLMADGTTKKIEDITHSDWLRVWNFDDGQFDIAQPLWIKKAETTNRYNYLEFSDGSSLKTIYQHRIFNKELGAFTFPMTEDTPIGTTTFNSKGEEVTLVSKEVVMEQIRYYNVITYRHMNLFANGILTSCMYNNVYPIKDMKFVKEDRELIPQAVYGVEDKYYEGLRLAEQTIPVTDTLVYVKRLELLKLEPHCVIINYSPALYQLEQPKQAVSTLEMVS